MNKHKIYDLYVKKRPDLRWWCKKKITNLIKFVERKSNRRFTNSYLFK